MIRKAKRHKAKIAIFIAWFGFLSSPVWGIGLGEIELGTPLNEPLHAEIQLLQVRDLGENDLIIGLAPKADFEAAGVERLFFLTSLKFTLDLDNPKGPLVIVTTDAPVREPYLNFLLEVQWPNGRLLREYTLLMDLPTFAEPQSVAKPILGTTAVKVEPAKSPKPDAAAAPLDVAALEAELASMDDEAPVPVAQAPVANTIDDVAMQPEAKESEVDSSVSDQSVEGATIEEELVSASVDEAKSNDAAEQAVESEPVMESEEEAPVAEVAEEPAQQEEMMTAEEPAPVAQEQSPTYNYAPAVPVYATTPSEYTTIQGDNLWNIAVRQRQHSSECTSREYKCEDGITIQQTMLAIQRANPEAFINSNINQLKKGRVLRMPSQDEITESTSREAIEEVRRQNIAWSGDPDGRRDRVVANEQLDATYADGSDTTTTEEYEDGRLKLSVPGSAEGSLAGKGSGIEEGSVEALQNEMVIAMEELDRIKREKTGTTDQINALDDQVKTLNKMLQVRSAELQALQAAAEAELVENATATGETVEGTTDSAETTDEQVLSQEQIDETIEAETTEQQVEPQAVEPPPVVVEEAQAPAEPGLMDMLKENLMYIGIALAVVLIALIAMVVIRKRASSSDADLDMDDAEETMMDMDSSFEGEKILDDLDDVADSMEQSLLMDEDIPTEEEFDLSPTEEAKPETSDAVSEADIYISFGSFDKAESLLKSAIKSEPRRADLQLKLLEVYVGSDNLAAFDQQFETLAGLGDAGATERAREMRNRISGADDTPLEGDISFVAEETVEGGSGLDLDMDLDFGADADVEPSTDLDFDLDLSLDDDISVSESPTVSQPAINLSNAPTVQQPAINVSEAPTGQQPSLDDMPTAVSPAVQVGEANTEMREELDLDLSELEGELDDLSMDADTGSAVANDQPTPSNTGLDEEFDFLADADEAATKLDLARAYIDMGDKEGAKDILQEVVEEGQEAQKNEARELLESIG